MRFTIDADPVPLARPRFANGRTYLPEKSRKYRKIIQDSVKAQLKPNFKPLEGEIICRLKFYRKFNPSSQRFGDLDNHVKAVLDATQNLLFKNDSQVISITAEKFQDTEPHTVISFKTKTARH